MDLLLDGSVEATDDKTITWTLSKPFRPLLEVLAKQSAAPPFIMPERVAQTPPREKRVPTSIRLRTLSRSSRPICAKAAERTAYGLWSAIGRVVDLFTSAECRNYSKAAGYDAT
jgi:ABC-type transport system substrate-binding protein